MPKITVARHGPHSPQARHRRYEMDTYVSHYIRVWRWIVRLEFPR